MRQIVYRAAALGDLKSISDFVGARNPIAADKIIQRITGTIYGIIADFPESGRLDPARGTREFVVSGLPYIVIYLAEIDQIEILAIFHTSRDPSTKPKS